MMNDIVLHQTTRAQLERFIASPTHAVLLTGPQGSGKRTVAEGLAAALLGLELNQLASYAYKLHLQPQPTSISIDAIRELQKFLQLKTAGQHTIRRVIIIEQAHTLTIEAQNAYLKLLEEPPADTVMLLTANTPRGLLPTILSRTFTIPITPPSQAQVEAALADIAKDETAFRQAYFLSGGLPGLLYSLLDGDQTHPLLASIAQAKTLLQQEPFERLATVETFSKQKENALSLVEAFDRIAQAGLLGASQKNETSRIRQWHRVRKMALQARSALQAGANTKLTLSNLFLQL